MPIRSAVALLLASLVSLPCQAKDAKVGQASLVLTAPTGQCELDPMQAGDARMLKTTEDMFSTRCRQPAVGVLCRLQAAHRLARGQTAARRLRAISNGDFHA